MNRAVANLFTSPYPTAIQTSLDSYASIARYDPSGRFIVAGRVDGIAIVWDLDTKGPVRTCEGHVKGITSVDWSHNSRYVLTSSKDWNVIVWDLASDSEPPRRRSTIRFDVPVVFASFHPKNSKIILVLLSSGEVYIVDQRKEYKGRYELIEALDESDDEGQYNRSRSAPTAARFDPSGKHVFVGTTLGTLLVFNTRTKTMIARHKIAGAGIIRGLEFVASGRRIVTNSSDRVLRQFNLPVYAPPNADGEYIEQELEPTHRFHDPISKVSWHAMSYSPDGEWLAGGAADDAAHKIYIWDLAREGLLASTLDGGRELLTYVHWHPHKPSIASVTNLGNIFIWHCPTDERWGAFAGGFEEVDENVEYEEREDEFDIEDEAEIARRKMLEEEEDVDIESGVEEVNGTADHTRQNGENDEDILWALEEPDDDMKGWELKVIMDEEDGV
ncbi:COMPASS complex protein [Dichomitus squalens]|uniref:COMPASS complex protein n=1 Tax=Dichomitus squalens TaxID=114155 RepID=A0A4Q9MKY1_9APHY|nr:COMPASS complex protein [Dichomitus squalens LYAD-421 SS1]EJF63084.1 COMPASS complex protein [Dichomitus squalens LYAD-421 SS1]TBU27667.1 COMPASS complex protein [Dichomitus squalens]TBU50537.1 COMPASS complex protein [Dichomitus squalens]